MRPDYMTYSIEQRLKDIREGQMYVIECKLDVDELLKRIPIEDIPLYINADIQQVSSEDGYLFDRSGAWIQMLKEKMNGVEVA